MKKTETKNKNVTIADKASADPHKVQNEKSKKCLVSTTQVIETETTTNYTPKEFDTFIPWVCSQWASAATVVILRKAQEEYVNVCEKRTVKLKKNKPKDEVSVGDIHESSVSLNEFPENSEVPITVYYDVSNQLVEISIIECVTRVPRKVIRAFSLSVPYQTSLKRFTFCKSHLTAELIYEINKLLLISNICELILDDSNVPEGNYFILLEQLSHLKYLSLNRCKINDEVCKNIFKNIHFDAPAAKTLQILDLGSNNITDDGATFIGSALRSNRCLLHINLSGNGITDSGFRRILDSLVEFQLNNEEKNAAAGRKVSYLQSKMAVYARCLDDLKSGNVHDSTESISGRKFGPKHHRLKKTTSIKSEPIRTFEDEAETMTRDIVGEFHDPFSPQNVVLRNELTYCKGNFVLCSLNIAYNHIEYPSVRKLSEVLEYQDGIFHTHYKDTGLLRIILEGNRIPETCAELDAIGWYLKKNVNFRKASDGKRRKGTTFHKKNLSHVVGLRQHSSSQLI
ncbi:hypothetical protein PYW08_008794 [Mythimna loreyi]|uniref:Uncharacterized protein n=1 Tax=Mythimna loreyi TaxID=667449 RepID=A0ACC2QC52_9NEOP|nr:hypothetical protein PYW08_008794 [Mythimna loreyi]